MSWFPDMGTVTMVDAGDHVRAVGWLSATQPFPEGDVPVEFVSRVKEFARRWFDSTRALDWGMFMGWHSCELCGRSRASGNFGVPSGDVLYAAPEMVAHYVEVHRYRPPDEFIIATLRSPLPGTPEYEAAVEPFRRLHQEYLERQRQERIGRASRWVFEHGGDENAIKSAAFRFFANTSPETCERIRRAMQRPARGVSPPKSAAAEPGR